MMPNASNYYADAAPAEVQAPTESEAAPKPEQEDETGEAQTAELPKTVLGGKDFKPGEEVVLEVVQVMDDSVLVKYASEKGGKEEYSEGGAEQSRAPTPGGSNPGNPMYG